MYSQDNPKTMDEEKSFEVIPEEAQVNNQQVNHQKDFDTHLVRRGLTEVSAMFDRHGKGYLDDTERALRRMDSQNMGYLGVDKVCVIFESLQAEQERSSQLLEALRTESKKSLNLKKGVIALSVFAMLLALANVGTSFAVSKLVKDMEATSNGDLIGTTTGLRLGTTAKLESFEMASLDETRRRRLQVNSQLSCERMTGAAQGDTEKVCELQGVMKVPQANNLHQQLKNVDAVQLVCNGKRSKIFGGTMLEGTPSNIPMGAVTYRVFPDGSDTNEKYQGVQQVNKGNGQGKCNANFELAMYCPTQAVNGQQQECLVMSAFQPTSNCPTPPVVCGPKPEQPSYIN